MTQRDANDIAREFEHRQRDRTYEHAQVVPKQVWGMMLVWDTFQDYLVDRGLFGATGVYSRAHEFPDVSIQVKEGQVIIYSRERVATILPTGLTHQFTPDAGE